MKTLLKMIIGLAICIVLFLFVLKYFEKQKGAPGTTPAEVADIAEPTPEAKASISDVVVNAMQDDAMVQIKEVKDGAYEIMSSEDGKEIVVEFSNTEAKVEQPSLMAPHPYVERITTEANGDNTKMTIALTEPVEYSDRVLGSMLYLTLKKGAAEEEMAPEPEPTRAPVVSKPKPRPVKKAVVAAKPKPKPAPKKVEPKSTKEEDDAFLDELGINDEPAAGGDDLALGGGDLGGDDLVGGGLDGDDDLGGLDGGDDLGGLDGGDDLGLDPEPIPGDDLAAVDPNEQFNQAPAVAGLPVLRSLNVVNDGGVTKVMIERDAKTKYKILRQRNPSRVVVDFLNASQGLQPSYGGFQGTKVQKVTTKQFSGQDGTISRVVFYVSGDPEYQKNNSGKTFVLELP